MTALALSVVVASYGRPRALSRCLTGLMQLRGPAVEIIVVADRDGLDVARSLSGAETFHFVSQSEPNLALARNAGLAKASGEIVAFIDDDAVPEATWAARIREAFAAEDLAAVTGPVLGRNGISLQWGQMTTDQLGVDRWRANLKDAGPDEVLKLHGTNVALRRAVFDRLGGFDPAFAFYLDDTDLSRRIAAENLQTQYDESIVVHHSFAASSRRTEARVPVSLFDVGASTAVFLRKYASAQEFEPTLDALRADQRARLWRWVKRRKLDARALRQLSLSLEEGLSDGHDRLSSHPQIVPDSPALRPWRAEDGPKMEVLFGWRHQARRLRAEAERRVLAGKAVTLLLFEPTPRKHKVFFTHGGWWEHTGGLYGPSVRTDARIQTWRFSARVRAELERVARVRGLD